MTKSPLPTTPSQEEDEKDGDKPDMTPSDLLFAIPVFMFVIMPGFVVLGVLSVKFTFWLLALLGLLP